jgi:cellulase (glycosyl hydrolase family 5)
MKFLKLATVCASAALAAGCGGGGMGSNGGGGGGGTNPTQASVTVSASKSGAFSVAMSTSFQPADWDFQFFTLNPTATTTLGQLGPHHVRLQGIVHGVPQGSEGTASTAWGFSTLDAITQPVLGVGDHSPEFQIAKAPAFMYDSNNSGNAFTDLSFAQFAGYTQNLVRYYNMGGFVDGGTTFVSSAWPNDKITWWGIYNEPNINNTLTPQQYTDMYNTVVPAMQAIDPTIKLAAVELADFSGQEQAWIPTFVSGVTAHVDVLATHFYSSCNQKDSDANVLATIPGFVTDVQAIYGHMAANSGLVNVPVWVTENNVNADFSNNGMSNCNPNQVFVGDLRGSSPFFAAWRPYVFSQLGQAGAQALYHWDFGADKQYGEVDYNTGALQLSYWVDYWLGQAFPPSAGSQLLQFTSSDNADLEILPVMNSDGSVVVMVANHAVNNPATDNNGPGVPFSVTVDVSALGNFSSASLLVIDKDTSAANGPATTTVTPTAKITMDLNGYSVGILSLKP